MLKAELPAGHGAVMYVVKIDFAGDRSDIGDQYKVDGLLNLTYSWSSFIDHFCIYINV